MDSKTKKIIGIVVGVILLLLVIFGLTKAFSGNASDKSSSAQVGNENISVKSNHAVTGKVKPKKESAAADTE